MCNQDISKVNILVVGSSNTDMVISTDHLPLPGETVLGGTFFMNHGGKGANQAVAIARLGGNVSFICKTGSDLFGHQAQQLFEEEGIDSSWILLDHNKPSGVALITVDGRGENCIVVAPGANASLLPQDIKRADEALMRSEYVLLQLEIPMETVEYVAERASEEGKKVILNPAPANQLSGRLLQHLFMITPNKTEAEMISGVTIKDEDSAFAAAECIYGMGVKNVVITLGRKGALIYNDLIQTLVPAVEVTAVDTTAAGDVFNGALVESMAEGRGIEDAVRFACKASALSVTRQGAQASIPYRNEVDVFKTN